MANGIEIVRVDELQAHPMNPRVHPDSAINKLARSIEEFGWTNPVLVSADGVVLAGHARVKAAEKLGLEEVPIIRLELSGDRADAYLVADNRLQDDTSWDMPLLREVISELDTGAIDLELTGFDAFELERIMTGFPPPGSDDEEEGEREARPITCPECGHSWIP